MSKAPRVGLGSDLHILVEGRPLMLGTIEIPFSHGLQGHSDADVLCHAIADALLGAAALGEIGSLFPDTAPKWKGLAGSKLLGEVAMLLKEAGWKITNIDSVVTAERPRLAQHKEAMIAGVAKTLGVGLQAVSVKIKSNERQDSIGRGEAIAAQAIACIEAIE